MTDIHGTNKINFAFGISKYIAVFSIIKKGEIKISWNVKEKNSNKLKNIIKV